MLEDIDASHALGGLGEVGVTVSLTVLRNTLSLSSEIPVPISRLSTAMERAGSSLNRVHPPDCQPDQVIQPATGDGSQGPLTTATKAT